MNTRILTLVAAALLATGCGGDGGSPTSSDGGGTTTYTTAGTWNSVSVNSSGVPGSRYYFEVSGSDLMGHAYWRYNGLLEHVGEFTGTVDGKGNVSWTLILDDNGWDGTETATAKISGSRMTGTYEWRSPDGTLREDGPFSLDREPAPVELDAGDGFMGDPGYWRGSMLYLSGGDCNSTGYLWTIVFDEGSPVVENDVVIGANLTGRVSARTFAGGGAPSEPSAYLGPLGSTLTGRRLDADDSVEFTLTGDLVGTFAGGVVETSTTYILSGAFTNGTTCLDNAGSTTFGGFTATAAKPQTR